MLKQFLNHLKVNGLCTPSDRLLLAVSGGLDSMVMLHLFLEAGYKPAVAHCNFGLRPEAPEEEAHVSEVCRQNGLPFFARRFDTEAHARSARISTQVAARELRYRFFEEVMTAENFTLLATAHHAIDSLETVLINLARGTGIDGVAGIPVRKGKIIRPLLFASRKQIAQFARERGIVWKEDSSNAEDHYSRNLIRHHVLPRLREINPGLDESITSTLQRLRGARDLAANAVDAFRSSAVSAAGDEIRIDLNALWGTAYPDVLLWEMIKAYGFSFDQSEQMMQRHQTGKRFSSRSHHAVVDRDHLIVYPVRETDFPTLSFSETSGRVQAGDETLVLNETDLQHFALDTNPEIAYLDLDRLRFPLTWRKWKDGDVFVPLGMTQHKKISDFLIDRKLSRRRKDTVTVIESEGEIVWVVGLRISDQAKITASTSRILVIRHQRSGDDSA